MKSTHTLYVSAATKQRIEAEQARSGQSVAAVVGRAVAIAFPSPESPQTPQTP